MKTLHNKETTTAPGRPGNLTDATSGFRRQLIALLAYLLHVGDLTPELFTLIVLILISRSVPKTKKKIGGTRPPGITHLKSSDVMHALGFEPGNGST